MLATHVHVRQKEQTSIWAKANNLTFTPLSLTLLISEGRNSLVGGLVPPSGERGELFFFFFFGGEQYERKKLSGRFRKVKR